LAGWIVVSVMGAAVALITSGKSQQQRIIDVESGYDERPNGTAGEHQGFRWHLPVHSFHGR
jgi:hypothetical protein